MTERERALRILILLDEAVAHWAIMDDEARQAYTSGLGSDACDLSVDLRHAVLHVRAALARRDLS